MTCAREQCPIQYCVYMLKGFNGYFDFINITACDRYVSEFILSMYKNSLTLILLLKLNGH